MGRLTSVAGRPCNNESSRILPKLIIPSQQQPINTSPLSSIYYPAYDYFYAGTPETPVLAHSWRTPTEPKPDCTDDGHSRNQNGTLVTPVPAHPATLAIGPAVDNASFRGSSKPTSLPATREQSPVSPVAAQAKAALVSAAVPRFPQKRALLIGINYVKYGKERLYRAAQDAHRFAETLKKQGYSENEMKVVTDEEGQPLPSSEYLLECISWLVRDASEGDKLFFMFSGHCEPPKPGKPEPYLVAADMMAIPRSTFQEHLVTKVPAGAELTIVLDCCNAAGMVELKYCVGRMEYEHESKQMGQPGAQARPASGAPNVPQQRTLHGIPTIGPVAPPFAPQPAPTMANQVPSFAPVTAPLRAVGGVYQPQPLATPFNVVPNVARPSAVGAPIAPHMHRRPGVGAGQPLFPPVVSNQVPGSRPTSSLPQMAPITTGPSSSAAQRPPTTVSRGARALVVEGRPLPHFEERKGKTVAPAGKVVVLAGTRLGQRAFEPSTDAKNSIVTEAICNVLDTCPNNKVTRLDVWHSIVKAIDEENTRRSGRDKQKDQTKLALNTRLQCAQVWASQEDPLKSPSPILNQPMF